MLGEPQIAALDRVVDRLRAGASDVWLHGLHVGGSFSRVAAVPVKGRGYEDEDEEPHSLEGTLSPVEEMEEEDEDESEDEKGADGEEQAAEEKIRL